MSYFNWLMKCSVSVYQEVRFVTGVFHQSLHISTMKLKKRHLKVLLERNYLKQFHVQKACPKSERNKHKYVVYALF